MYSEKKKKRAVKWWDEQSDQRKAELIIQYRITETPIVEEDKTYIYMWEMN